MHREPPESTGGHAGRTGIETRSRLVDAFRASSLHIAGARVHAGGARALVGDRNLQGMLESAVGDIETLTRVIGVDALMAMRDAEREGRSPADFQGRITLVFDDESEADSVAVVGHAIATYVVGSAPRPAAPGLKTTCSTASVSPDGATARPEPQGVLPWPP